MKIKITLAIVLLTIIQSFGQIQVKEKAPKNQTQSHKYQGPWSIGINLGVPIVVGDMETRFGYGASLNIQKSLSPMFALRVQALALEAYGLDHSKYFNKYANFKTRFTDYTLQGVVTLNNLSFYYKEPKVLINIIAGGGFATKHSWLNKYDNEGNLYTYENFSGSDAETIKAVNEMTDNNYETIVKKDGNRAFINNTTIMPSIVIGGGLVFKISKSIDLNLETRASFHHSDKLDAHSRGIATDWLSYSSVGLIIRLNSKKSDTRWANPIYSSINKTDSIVEVDESIKDSDNDGVADVFDLDLYTPPNVAVNTKGVAIDSDKDGVPDYKDSQLFSPLNAQVSKDGVAIDTDKDGVADVFDLEMNSEAGSQVDAKGRTIIVKSTINNTNTINTEVKYVFFDVNSSVVKEEFYPRLFEMASIANSNPAAQIFVTGFTDNSASSEYNLNLSKKRANAVEKLLVNHFNVSSSSIVKKHYGEENPIINSALSSKDNKSSYINRRVELEVR